MQFQFSQPIPPPEKCFECLIIPDILIFGSAERACAHPLQVLVGRVEVVVDTPELVEELGAHRTLDIFGRREAEVNLKYYNQL